MTVPPAPSAPSAPTEPPDRRASRGTVPEGHTIHRVALQLGADLVGRPVAASSPQGRFAAGAALLDGRVPTAARAHGKHFFLHYLDAAPVVLRVHLGL